VAKALYRKYRSKKLDEVIGQKHITDILKRAIETDSLSHAYLLTGPRGVGKTSVARILAYEINKLEYDENATNLDIIEIDAASNNGVEDVRDLREKVQIAPVSASKKIYIIDEVHMLSKAAFNALLKTLEEPPSHVIFILATTNVEKLPATIISRTQRFSFRPITIEDAVKHLDYIAKEESIKINDEALRLIALRSDGSFRDSISLLDQLSSLVDADGSEITAELIEESLGLAPQKTIKQILEAVENHNISEIVSSLKNAFDKGASVAVLVEQVTGLIREEIVEKPHLLPLLDSILDVPKSPQPQLKLLSVLGMASTPKTTPKTVALLAPVMEVSASVLSLEKKALKKGSKAFDATTSNGPLEPESDQAPGPNSDPERSRTVKSSSSKGDRVLTNLEKNINIDFDWNKLIDYTKQNYVALYSVLSKCNYEIDDSELNIYTNSSFYKKKLDDPKYSALISKCIQDIGSFELNIHTIPTPPPLKDSQAAAIAAIMGGGEEVALEPSV
jgi:DNA polymerase-3 subunit gamma/tau